VRDDIPDPEVSGVDEDPADSGESEATPPDGFTVVTWTKEDFVQQLQKTKVVRAAFLKTTATSKAPATASSGGKSLPSDTVMVDGSSDGRAQVSKEPCPFCYKTDGHKTQRSTKCGKHGEWKKQNEEKSKGGKGGGGAPSSGPQDDGTGLPSKRRRVPPSK
jgi:hypothetical protein